MWQGLVGRRHREAMQGMMMLPFDNRSFVFSYVLVLGAHTLITKTLLIWALFFAAASWNGRELALAVLCGCMACLVTAAVFAAAAASTIAAALYLAHADAYDFYIASAAKKAVRYAGRTGSVFTYLMRYLMANKSYLVNTAGLCGIACLLPLLFGGF